MVELWDIPAEDLLATGELGIVPWVPLSYLSTKPEPLLKECRKRIDQQAPPGQHEALLAVTQFLARLRFDARVLAEIFGGVDAMLELPFLDEILEKKAEERAERKVEQRIGPIVAQKVAQQVAQQVAQKVAQQVAQKVAQQVAQKSRKHILLYLRGRFGPSIRPEISEELEAIEDDARLDELVEWAATCLDVDAFRAKLTE